MQIPNEKLKESLVKDGLVAPQVFDELAAESSRMKHDVAETLISRGIITQEYLTEVLGSYFGVQKAGLSGRAIDEQGFHLFSPTPNSQTIALLQAASNRTGL